MDCFQRQELQRKYTQARDEELKRRREIKEGEKKAAKEAREEKRALAKQKGSKHFALTGNFGYQRAFVGLVLKTLGYSRVKRVNRTTGFLLVGEDHQSGPITNGWAYKEALKYNTPVKTLKEVDPLFDQKLKILQEKLIWSNVYSHRWKVGQMPGFGCNCDVLVVLSPDHINAITTLGSNGHDPTFV